MSRPSPLHRAALAAAACAVVAAVAAVPASGQSVSDLESKIAAAEREAELSATLARGQERAAQLEAEVAATEAALAETRERLRRALDALADRLVAMYKGDEPDSTTLILDADGFDDLATRTEYL